jgi:hypothetical protein
VADWREAKLELEQLIDEVASDPDTTSRLTAALESQRQLMREQLDDGALVFVSGMRILMPVGTDEIWYPLFWVDWLGTGPWPSDEDDHVFGRIQKGPLRRQSWLYHSGSEAARLVRELWGLELAVPPDLN